MRIVFYRNSRGTLLALDWLRKLRWRDRYRYKCSASALFELGVQGRGLGLPVSRHLADGFYALRTLEQGRPEPLIYFFHEDAAVVLGAAKRDFDPLPLATLVRACRHRRAYERDPHGRSHAAAVTGRKDVDGLELLERLTGFESVLRERIEEERLVLQVAQAAHLFRRLDGHSDDPFAFHGQLSTDTLAQLERGQLGTQMVQRLQRIGWRLELDVRLVLIPRPRNGRRRRREQGSRAW
ncbi:MAG: hypothetical protein IPJ19_17335 [Planctomycetes bacterium]|nr:hypothetical protein [Planctomycetota bacterium]